MIIAGTNLDSGRARAGSLFPICLDTATRQSFTSLINHLSVVDVSLTCTSYWASYNDSTGPGCDSAPQPRGISLADPTLSLDVKAPRARLGSPVLGNNLRRVSVSRLVVGFYEVIRGCEQEAAMCSNGGRVSGGMPIRLFWPLPPATNDEAASDAGPDGAALPSHCSSGYPHVVAGRWSLVFVMTEGYRAGAANRSKSGDSPKPSS